MALSEIEWTDATWNPVTGCDKISPGCKHCYAERMAKRLRAMGQRNYAAGFALRLQPHMLEAPLTWKKPRTIFVNSMSDLFHKDVPLEYIARVFDVMRRAHWHTFQVLTKRSERLVEVAYYLETQDIVLPKLQNVWLGVSVEAEKYRNRIDHLRLINSHVRFLSLEPLLGDLGELDLRRIDWVIVGGESGPGARPMHPDWARAARDQCVAAKVPFFFKQWGAWAPTTEALATARICRSTGADVADLPGLWSEADAFMAPGSKSKNGRLLDGRTWDEMPTWFSEVPEVAAR